MTDDEKIVNSIYRIYCENKFGKSFVIKSRSGSTVTIDIEKYTNFPPQTAKLYYWEQYQDPIFTGHDSRTNTTYYFDVVSKKETAEKITFILKLSNKPHSEGCWIQVVRETNIDSVNFGVIVSGDSNDQRPTTRICQEGT